MRDLTQLTSGLETPLAAWADQYQSLRQVTTQDLTTQLAPLTGATWLLALSATRSLFTTLKARRVLFTNPAAPLTGRALQSPPVLPLDDTQRARLLARLTPASGSSCCWPGCTRCGPARSAP